MRDIGDALLVERMQQVPALDGVGLALEFGEAGDAPDVGVNAKILFEQRRARDDFAQDRAAAEQLHVLVLGRAFGRRFEQIHALDDALFRRLPAWRGARNFR